MRSLRTRITLITVFVVIIAIVLFTVVSVVFIRKNEQKKSDQLLLLLCETGEKNLDYYFNSVQKSVRKVGSFAEADLDGLDDLSLTEHVERVADYFDEVASRTNGVLTYYYRIDPAVSDTVKGFWFTDLDGEGFVEHEVTDITQYDTEDTSNLVWFTVPKYEGEAIWLAPYVTDNLDVLVISYNIPVYHSGQFVGVVGIEIDYTTMSGHVDSIRLYSNGYAFLSDSEGNLFYHPHIDVTDPDHLPEVPKEMLSESTFFKYTFDGVDKAAAWLPLSNGMRLNVTAPVSETEGSWKVLVWDILFVAAIVLILAVLFTMVYTQRIVRPLKELTEAAQMVDNGYYDYALTYNQDDELGRLTATFRNLSDHMKEHISDLSHRVFTDALTHVKNRSAFLNAVEEMQEQINEDRNSLKFAVGMFDVNYLKEINDTYGHDKGDLYLKAASSTICTVFQHSPVYRIGGDEFATILRNADYQNRDLLEKRFEAMMDSVNASTDNVWEHVHLAMGIADYDPETDETVNAVVKRADDLMYHKKSLMKEQDRTANGEYRL